VRYYISGIRSQAVVETGMDVFEEQEGEVSDDNYFKKNNERTSGIWEYLLPVPFREQRFLV